MFIGVRFAWVDVDPLKDASRDDDRPIILEMLTSKLPLGPRRDLGLIAAGGIFSRSYLPPLGVQLSDLAVNIVNRGLLPQASKHISRS